MQKLILLLAMLVVIAGTGQEKPKLKTFTQKDFNAHQIGVNTYDLWDHLTFGSRDTIPFFVDTKDYKGIINYGLEFSAEDKRTVTYIEDYSIYFHELTIERCTFNPKDSIAEITGSFSGGWNIVEMDGASEKTEIFIGEIKDSLFKVTFRPGSFITTYKNHVRKDAIVLDSLPAFYFKKLIYRQGFGGNRKNFSIRCKVNEKSVFALARFSCYAEIYDLGKLFFGPAVSGKSRPKRAKDAPRFVRIIEKNVQVNNPKPEKPAPEYYQFTEKAEGYILMRQYAKAKETYAALAQKYPTLFARDIHNAIRVFILSRDMKSAFTWSEKLATKGVGLSYFKAKLFDGMRKNPQWKTFCVKYDSLSKLAISKQDEHLKVEVDALVREDQNDYGLENRKEPQILYETTARVTGKLAELLKREGFPTEERIGVFMKNDTTLVTSPDYNVIIRHAVQQKPEGLKELIGLLEKKYEAQEYDMKRSPNHRNFPSACFHIYKGNLYLDKSCGNNEQMVLRMTFMFNNPNGFIMDNGNFIVSEYNKESPEEWDKYYNEKFNLITKLTDEWEFYEK
ncbi:Tetratricopeptide repeat protein [Flavobacterium longum]|uniref:hypothetical protein n=1 Tax=Flavobacterium longum TaxID=1299340 RepID=UPI0039E88B1F